MGRWGWGAALAGAAAVLAGAGWEGASPPGALRGGSFETDCELRTADRAATPAAACLACHDGSVGTGVSFQMRAMNRPGFDHPVDVDYARAALRDRRLLPPALLPPDVVLVNGRVACTTCHDGGGTERGHTVRGREDLCRSCHQM
jgi:predicted CXXCH cytochrome family protein